MMCAAVLGTLGKYELLRILGVGGMGEVMLARQHGPAGFKKMVVVKKIIDSLSTEPAMVKMFLHEASLIAHLSHPNIVQVIELGEENGQYFIVMEYVHGQTLRTLMKRTRDLGKSIPPVTLALIMAQVLRGLHHAHTARSVDDQPLNLVHRDVTPDNIIVGYNGVVKLLDFGIAKVASPVTEKTEEGVLKGKVAYLSPEQLLGEPLDGRADLFSVGVTMYEALAGERPFVAATNAAVVHRVLEAEPTPLPSRAPEVPPVLDSLVISALEKKRDNRIASAEVFATALEDWAASMRDVSPGTSLTDFLAINFDEASRRQPSYADLGPLMVTSAREKLEPGSSAIDDTLMRGRRPRWQFSVGGALAAIVAGAIIWAVLPNSSPQKPADNPRVQPAVVVDTPKVNPPPVNPPPVNPVDPLLFGPGNGKDPKDPHPPIATDTPEVRVPSSAGRVDLRVIPWGEVFEGKRRLGLTPMQPVSLTPGPHTLTIVNSDMNKKKDVRVVVRAGHTVALKVDLLE